MKNNLFAKLTRYNAQMSCFDISRKIQKKTVSDLRIKKIILSTGRFYNTFKLIFSSLISRHPRTSSHSANCTKLTVQLPILFTSSFLRDLQSENSAGAPNQQVSEAVPRRLGATSISRLAKTNFSLFLKCCCGFLPTF